MIDQKEFRARIETRLKQLSDRTARIGRDLGTARNPDSQERATESENDEVLEGLNAVEHVELARLRHALARLEAGTYSQCEGCGEEIPEARLEVAPETSRCVACA